MLDLWCKMQECVRTWYSRLNIRDWGIILYTQPFRVEVRAQKPSFQQQFHAAARSDVVIDCDVKLICLQQRFTSACMQLQSGIVSRPFLSAQLDAYVLCNWRHCAPTGCWCWWRDCSRQRPLLQEIDQNVRAQQQQQQSPQHRLVIPLICIHFLAWEQEKKL